MVPSDLSRRDQEEAEDLHNVAKATIWSSGAFLVGLPVLLAVWVLVERDAMALVHAAVVAMLLALIALGGGHAAADLGRAASNTTSSAARGYRRTGLVVGYLSLFLVTFEAAIIALVVILGYTSG